MRRRFAGDGALRPRPCRRRRWWSPACASWARRAKILSPHKRVLMPDLDATCSLDLGCPADEFAAFCDAHPDRKVVVYANTSAAVKARADWMVTSSCALAIVQHLKDQGQKILWAPDRHLGRYIQDADRRRHAAVERRVHRARRVQGAGAGAAAQRAPAGAWCWCTPNRPQAWSRRPTWSARPRSCSRRCVDGTRQRIHRRHRQRPDAPHAPAGAGQDADRGADRRQQRHLQELRALPVDGDERAAGRGRLPGEAAAARSRCPSRSARSALGCIERMLDFVKAHPASMAQPRSGFVPNIGVA